MSLSTAEKILIEQIKLLNHHTPLIVSAGLLIAGLTVLVLSAWVPEDDLRLWFGAVFLLSALRFFSLWRHLKTPTTPKLAKARARLLTVYSGLSGCQWGYLGYFQILPEQPMGRVVIVMALISLVVSGIASLSQRLPIFYAFTIPALVPTAYSFSTLSGDIFKVVAVLIALFLFTSLFYANRINKTLLKSIRARVENVNLIFKLSLEKQRAEQANIAKSKFLATASHDLRQPMHALNLFATTLEERIQDPANKALVNNICSSVKGLSELFNALLDISKLDAGTLHVEKQHFKLKDLLDHLQNDFMAQANEKALRLDINSLGVVVYSDPLLLERMLRNLLSNAIRFTKAGKVTINVIPLDGAVCIEIKDTGSGIADEALETIFEEFVQLHNTALDRSKGLGLGLSIVKRIASLLGHPISVKSSLGIGSIFSLVVPLGNYLQQTSMMLATQELEQDCSRIFVLVIDDEPAIREGMSSLLTNWGCLVLAVGSVKEAVAVLADYEYPPDAILADYRLRDHSTGTEAVATIRALYDSEISALIISGDTTVDRLKEANASGLPVLHKPFEPAQLRTYLGSIARKIREKELKIADEP